MQARVEQESKLDIKHDIKFIYCLVKNISSPQCFISTPSIHSDKYIYRAPTLRLWVSTWCLWYVRKRSLNPVLATFTETGSPAKIQLYLELLL